MEFAGYFTAFILSTLGFAFSEGIFWKMTGRTYWRAMVPDNFRKKIIPTDKVKMDSFMVMEEWTALMLYCAYLGLPMIALNTMGLIHIFE